MIIQSVQCNEPWWGMLRQSLDNCGFWNRKVSDRPRHVWIPLELQSIPHSITRTLWPRQLPRWDRACLRGAFCWIKAFCCRVGPGKKMMKMHENAKYRVLVYVMQYYSSRTCIQSCRCRSSAAFRGKGTIGGCRAAWCCQTGHTFFLKMWVARKEEKRQDVAQDSRW